MKNLLYKEFRLATGSVNYVFMACAAVMLLMPNYPRYVPFYYICLGIFFIFTYGQINNDILFTTCLPVQKRDTVKARLLLVAALELIQVIISIPIAIFTNKFIPIKNHAGIESNVAFFGLLFVYYAVFNFVFITSFYRKAEKPGMPFLWANIVQWPVYVLLELPVWLGTPLGQYLDATDTASQIKQLPVLAGGIVIWTGVMFLTYFVSAKRFEKADL